MVSKNAHFRGPPGLQRRFVGRSWLLCRQAKLKSVRAEACARRKTDRKLPEATSIIFCTATFKYTKGLIARALRSCLHLLKETVALLGICVDCFGRGALLSAAGGLV